MKVRLKKLRDQVLVITGASSGIGLVTARMAARRGARLVLAARSGEELQRLAQEINDRGSQAVPVTVDVANEQDVQHIVDAALQYFHGFDTWVNDAGVSIFGRLEEVSTEDHRRLFDTNFWGVVYGSLAAAGHLKRRGGAIINLGSVVSDRAFPLQGMYSASKHAVKGFTDALRMELEHDGAPVSVSLIKPTSIATPFPRHAKNYLNVEPTLPPPVYAPDLVAKAILHCAEYPERDIYVGGASKMMSMAGHVSPRLMDKYEEVSSFRQQKSERPPQRDREGSLHRPSHDLSERGTYDRHIFERSAYTSARLHPVLAGAAAVAAGLAVTGLFAALRDRGDGT